MHKYETKDFFNTYNDFSTRLNRTIIRYKGDFYYSLTTLEGGDPEDPDDVDGAWILQLYKLTVLNKVAHKLDIRKVDIDDFDFGAASLGLVYYRGQTYDFQRAGVRRYRAGTPPDYLSARRVDHERFGEAPNVIVHSQGFEDMLNNKYTSVWDALNLLKTAEVTSVPVSRSMYLEKNAMGVVVLCYRNGEKISWIGNKGNMTYLDSRLTNISVKGSANSILNVIRQVEETKHAF